MEGREAMLKLITDAEGFPEPMKNLNVQIKGLRVRFLISKGISKILQKAKNLDKRKKKSYLLK